MARFREQMGDFASGHEFVRLRKARHESQETTAHGIGVSTKTLRAWEHDGPIHWTNAQRAGGYFGVEPEDLVTRELTTNEMFERVEARLDQLEAKVERLLALAGAAAALDRARQRQPSSGPRRAEPDIGTGS